MNQDSVSNVLLIIIIKIHLFVKNAQLKHFGIRIKGNAKVKFYKIINIIWYKK
jgi:hypothetical protein